MFVIGGMIMVNMLYTVAIYGLLCKIEKSLNKEDTDERVEKDR